MTNKLEISRELASVSATKLEYFASRFDDAFGTTSAVAKELRAILAAEPEECCHEFVPFQPSCVRCGEPYVAAPVVERQAIGWFTEDHLTDKSATTYDASVAARWRAKGWPVSPLYAEQTAPVSHQEPVAYMRNDGTPNNLVKCTFTCPGAFGVYRRPPAQVPADLSEVRAYHAEAQARLLSYANDDGLRPSDTKHYRKRAEFHGELIAKIDKVKELNQ